MREGLLTHGTDAFRDEMIRAIKDLYSPPDVFEAAKARLESYWTLLDQGGQPSEEDAEATRELTERLIRVWPRLSNMAADNKRFGDEAGRIAASMFVVGWEGLETAYARSDGVVPLGRIDDVELELGMLEQKAKADKVEGVEDPGTAFLQLTAASFRRLTLTETERKNSPSPPPSTPALNGSSRKRSSKTRAARSKGSASSDTATAS